MRDHCQLMGPNEDLTDAEIMRAICYLDPDLSVEKGGEDTGTVVGNSLALATVLSGALLYIGLYVRTQ